MFHGIQIHEIDRHKLTKCNVLGNMWTKKLEIKRISHGYF